MNLEKKSFIHFGSSYLSTLNSCFNDEIFELVQLLADDLLRIWAQKKRVFICGNGGSAANAIHLANDFHYGAGACASPPEIPGLSVDALPSNQGVITCLANDIGYEHIFSHQLRVKAKPDDLLIVLSGSGNSPNIVNALIESSKIGIRSFAILAFDGGTCKELADHAIHFAVDDMQVAEDTQLIVGHICMQWLSLNKPLMEFS